MIALMCVPWMLIAKPYLLHRANKQRQAIGTTGPESGMEDQTGQMLGFIGKIRICQNGLGYRQGRCSARLLS